MAERLRAGFRWVGIPGAILVALLLIYFPLPVGLPRFLTLVAIILVAVWLALRLSRAVFRELVWRVRHRLLITYLFIAVVPITLILAMALVSAYALLSQLAVYLVTSELDRRLSELELVGSALMRLPASEWPNVAPALMGANEQHAAVESVIRSGERIFRFPSSSTLQIPEDSEPRRELLLLSGRPYLWVHQKSGGADFAMVEPVTHQMLGELVPDLGIVDLADPLGVPLNLPVDAKARSALPPQANFLDRDVGWFTTLPGTIGDTHQGAAVVVGVHTRVSAVLRKVFNRISDVAQGTLLAFLGILSGLFLIVVGVAFIIGGAMTQSITGAVHDLYEATERVGEGLFSHRIAVRNTDQLGELSQSFNNMTAHVERLLTVAKEKERLESEVEIAREVQKHLYPRTVPASPTLRLAAICHPARTVSGDYYDYAALGNSRIALAMGDVAGKGISAALLMASLQSGLRSDWQGEGISTAAIVSKLNRQLHATTSPEKYATFCLAIYDEVRGLLTYTNAGHLPPILIRGEKATRLDVNGTVVGAFPTAKYDESYLALESGDLLVLYTDGVTESENTFGEMFGDERLEQLLLRNASFSEQEILDAVFTAVRQWAGTEELQDDITLLVARKL